MLPIDTLFLLVHSLSKSEKRYFRLAASLQKGDKAYLRLFNCLDGYKNFEEDSKDNLVKEFPGSTIEPARKHLYKKLMKSLRQFESEKLIESKIVNLISDSKILFDRDLIDPALKQIEKAKQLSIEHERLLYFLISARQELQFMMHLQLAGLDESSLIEKQEKINEVLGQASILQEHSSIYEILLLRYWKKGEARSLKEVTLLNDLLLEEHQLMNSKQFQTFESEQLHLHFQSTYFLMTGDPTESLKVFFELDELFLKNSRLWADSSLYYIHLLTGILNTLRRMEQYDQMTYFLDRLRSVSSTSDNLSASVTCSILEYEMHRAINKGDLEKALNFFEEKKETVNKEISQLPLLLQVQLQLTISRMWYEMGKYDKALKLINKVLNQPTNSFNRTLYVRCRLMNLIIHCALENTDYLFYEIRSIERKLKSEENFFQIEKLVIKIIKRWLNNKPFQNDIEKMALLLDNPFEQQLINELRLKPWAESMAKKSKASRRK
ncbi:MAG: hypothetical protein ACTHNG_04660 [Ginsengibacter sp.]